MFALTERHHTANAHISTWTVFNLGYFCIHHPTGINATPPQPLPQEVRFLAQPGVNTEESKGLRLSAVSVPVLSQHTLGMCVYFPACVAPSPVFSFSRVCSFWTLFRELIMKDERSGERRLVIGCKCNTLILLLSDKPPKETDSTSTTIISVLKFS